MIKVNGQNCNYKSGMTIADALQLAGESINAMTLVVVEGRILSIRELDEEILQDGVSIKTLLIISGG